MDNAKIALGVALVAVVIAIGGYFYPQVSHLAGEIGTRMQHGLSVGYTSAAPGGVAPTDGKLTVGINGTPLGTVNFGKCAILAYATTIAASTTATVDCSTTGRIGGTLTGITSTDNVMAMATTSLSTTYLGVRIVSANASTTAGYITLKIWNGTGKTFTWTGTASSTIAYQADQ